MRCHPLLGLALACIFSGSPLAEGAEPPARQITLIVDCSRSMDQTLEIEGPVREVNLAGAPTRMEATKDVLKATLTRLSSQGDHQTSIWLFGHRIAWEEKDDPALLEQTDYLEHSLGFKALEDLLPGDDVELVRPMTTLMPRDLPTLFSRLDTVKPWGEDPLYLSLVRALDSLSRDAASHRAAVIVITDGANKQWVSRFKATKQDVLDAADRRGTPVHIIALGMEADGKRQTEAEFHQIAERTRGRYHRANSAASIQEGIDAALDYKGPVAAPAIAAASAPAASAAVGPTTTIQPVADTVTATPKQFNVDGHVTCFGRDVRKAKITIEGNAHPPVVADGGGRFTLANLPAGSYKIHCDVIYKNKIYERSQEVVIQPDSESTVTVDVRLD